MRQSTRRPRDPATTFKALAAKSRSFFIPLSLVSVRNRSIELYRRLSRETGGSFHKRATSLCRATRCIVFRVKIEYQFTPAVVAELYLFAILRYAQYLGGFVAYF